MLGGVDFDAALGELIRQRFRSIAGEQEMERQCAFIEAQASG